MSIRVLETTTMQSASSETPKVKAARKFYADVLGLKPIPVADHPRCARLLDQCRRGRANPPDRRRAAIGAGEGTGARPDDPTRCAAVADIHETKAELDRLKVPYWSMTGINGPAAEQIFINDPSGNMVELHQVDQCRCRIANRV